MYNDLSALADGFVCADDVALMMDVFLSMLFLHLWTVTKRSKSERATEQPIIKAIIIMMAMLMIKA